MSKNKNKNNKLESLEQVDAKFVDGEVRTLSSLIGEDRVSPYSTANTEEYESYINELNLTDLHRHAEKVGLVPAHERRVLKERLLREFRKFVLARSVLSEQQINNHLNVDTMGSTLSKEAQKILREGA